MYSSEFMMKLTIFDELTLPKGCVHIFFELKLIVIKCSIEIFYVIEFRGNKKKHIQICIPFFIAFTLTERFRFHLKNKKSKLLYHFIQ